MAVKNNFVINVFDDIDYLNNSDFFNKNKNILFKIEDYEHLCNNNKLKPLVIHNSSVKTINSITSFNEEMFENIFENNNGLSENENTNTNLLDELVEVTKLTNELDNNISLKSNSTCSSRTSYTSNSENNNSNSENSENDTDINEDEYDSNNDSENVSVNDSNESNDYEEERIDASINTFPIQLICMEYCENTLDELILTNDLTNDEWYSILMQIIMILITYQKAFNFTHNDLHTNNVMYNSTNKKFIYYCYKHKYYKVPTFGRIFKIIDFGRSIYKVNGKLFCSDSFQNGEDAASQYNTEPYFNEKKPRLEPNYSFDICRLACSIFDYVIDNLDETKDLDNCDPIKRLIFEWCLDDKGINLLYKNNGTDRYPDFKLYKMIARCVHNHTPQAQLKRPEFNRYSEFKGDIPLDVINIDEIPIFI
jgi:hypothetical protein